MIFISLILMFLTMYYLFPWLLVLEDKYLRSYRRLPSNNEPHKYINTIPYGKFSSVKFHRKYIPVELDIIIIGSGMGSLTTAALLSLAGKKVLVLEQNKTAGGSLDTIWNREVEFETGLHYIGNINKRKEIYNLLTNNRIQWCRIGNNTYDSYIYDEIAIEKNRYQLPSGKNNLIIYLTNLFPAEEKGIREYFELVSKVAERNLFFKLKASYLSWCNRWIRFLDPLYYEYVNLTSQEVVDSLIKDTNLKNILLGQFNDYGIVPNQAPFYQHACIVNHFLDGGWFPMGGSGKLAEDICTTIWENGGAVLVDNRVYYILLENEEGNKRKAVGVEMSNGQIIYADKIISGIGVRSCFTNLVKSEKYNRLLRDIPPSIQHIYCFVSLRGSPKELELPSSNLWIYPDKNFNKLMKDYYEEPLENNMPLFIGSTSAKDSSWEERYPGRSNLIILTPFPNEYFENLGNKRSQNKKNEYRLLKTEIAQKMIREGIQKFYPKVLGKIVDYKVIAPLPNYLDDKFATEESYGLLSNKKRFLEYELLNPETEIENFYLTGQDIYTLGVAGAMMGGILTANHICGYGNILDLMLDNNIMNDLIIKKCY